MCSDNVKELIVIVRYYIEKIKIKDHIRKFSHVVILRISWDNDSKEHFATSILIDVYVPLHRWILLIHEYATFILQSIGLFMNKPQIHESIVIHEWISLFANQLMLFLKFALHYIMQCNVCIHLSACLFLRPVSLSQSFRRSVPSFPTVSFHRRVPPWPLTVAFHCRLSPSFLTFIKNESDGEKWQWKTTMKSDGEKRRWRRRWETTMKGDGERRRWDGHKKRRDGEKRNMHNRAKPLSECGVHPSTPHSESGLARLRNKLGFFSFGFFFVLKNMAVKKCTSSSRLERELFRKQRTTLFKKIKAMNKPSAEIYVVLHRHDHFYTYNSFASTWSMFCVRVLTFTIMIRFTKRRDLIRSEKEWRALSQKHFLYDRFFFSLL
jgi:hypothetical protein